MWSEYETHKSTTRNRHRLISIYTMDNDEKMDENLITADTYQASRELTRLERELSEATDPDVRRKAEEEVKAAHKAYKRALLMSGIDNRESGNTGETTVNGRGRKEEEVIDVDKDINTDQITREEVVKRINAEDNMVNTNRKKSKSDDKPWETAAKGGCNGNGGMQGRGRGSGSGQGSVKGDPKQQEPK